jgi:hypothetical protein
MTENRKSKIFRNGAILIGVIAGCALLWFTSSTILKDKAIGIIDAPFQGEIFMQGNMVHNLWKGNILRPFDTDYVNYPAGENLRFVIANSWHLYMYAPLRFFMGIIESYNALVMAVFLLNFLAAYFLARYLFSSRLIAFCSAVVFALNPYILLKMNLAFVQKICLFPMPLYCLMLFKLRDTMRWRYVISAGILLCLIQLIYPPYSVYMVLFTAPLAVYWILKSGRRLPAAAMFISVLLTHLFLTSLIYYLMRFGFVYLNSLRPVLSMDTEGCLDIFTPFLFFPYHQFPHPVYLPLGISFVCFLCGVLAAVKKKGLPLVLFMIFLGFSIIAAGPYLAHDGRQVLVFGHKVILPFYFLAKYLPFAGGIFFPMRVFPFINICLAILAGYGLTYLATAFKKAGPARIAVIFLFLYISELSVLFSPIFPPKISKVNIPEFCRRIKGEDFEAVLNLPVVPNVRTHNLYGYYSVLSGKKMVNSYWQDKLPLYLPRDSDDTARKEEFVKLLSRWRVGYIVIHEDIMKEENIPDEFGWLRGFCENVSSYPEDHLLVYKMPR